MLESISAVFIFYVPTAFSKQSSRRAPVMETVTPQTSYQQSHQPPQPPVYRLQGEGVSFRCSQNLPAESKHQRLSVTSSSRIICCNKPIYLYVSLLIWLLDWVFFEISLCYEVKTSFAAQILSQKIRSDMGRGYHINKGPQLGTWMYV